VALSVGLVASIALLKEHSKLGKSTFKDPSMLCTTVNRHHLLGVEANKRFGWCDRVGIVDRLWRTRTNDIKRLVGEYVLLPPDPNLAPHDLLQSGKKGLFGFIPTFFYLLYI
jgi:hypothetical protein